MEGDEGSRMELRRSVAASGDRSQNRSARWCPAWLWQPQQSAEAARQAARASVPILATKNNNQTRQKHHQPQPLPANSVWR